MRKGGATAVAEATRFFMKDDRVHKTLYAVTSRLDELGIPYAVAGGMALVAHGYDRTTEVVDILVNAEGLTRIHEHLEGRGYVRPFPTSKHLRSAQTGVKVEFLVTGQYPGDGTLKPTSFPEPADVGQKIDGITYISLPALVELKLASGMTNVTRVKDIGDVVELIRSLRLPKEFGDKLNPYVRDKFVELWTAIAHAPLEEG